MRVHQIAAGMRAEKLPDGIAFDVAVFNHKVIAGCEKAVKPLQNRGHVVVRVFDDEPGMRLRAQQFGREQQLGLEAVAAIKADARMFHLDLDQIDRMDARFDAAERKTIGEPCSAGASAGSDLEHRAWAKLGEQRRVQKSNTFFISGMPRQRMSDGAPWQVSSTSTPNSVPNRG